MARPKGSKNIPKEEDKVEPTESEPKPKVLIGYHPITGAEVWQ
jgi:hypothetical protein